MFLCPLSVWIYFTIVLLQSFASDTVYFNPTDPIMNVNKIIYDL